MSHPHPHRPRTTRPPHRLLVDRCATCGQVLAQADGCTTDPYPTVAPWGRESWWDDEPDHEPLERCPDCWARIGRPHHYDCIRAWCDTCRQPLYTCSHAEAAGR